MRVPDGDSGRGLRGWLSRLGSLRPEEDARPDTGSPPKPDDGPVVTSQGLRKFLSHLETRQAPVLLDLGAVVGPNITFFGDRLNCKVVIGDLFVEVERHAREGRAEELPSFLAKRFTREEASIDGVLLWDIYDYLNRPSAQALASALVRSLRPDGAVLGFFGNAKHVDIGCTTFVVENDSHVRLRGHGSALARQGWLQNRDIIKMFDGMRVTDSYLLQNGWREMLFRKGGGGRPII